MTAIKIKTVPMLALAASLSAGLMMSASDSAFARHNHGSNNGNNNGGNNSFNNNNNNNGNNHSFNNNGGNNGGSSFGKKDRKYSDKNKKKDQNQTGNTTTSSTTQASSTPSATTVRASNTVQGKTGSQSAALTTTPQNAGAGTNGNTSTAGNKVVTVTYGNNQTFRLPNGPGGIAVSYNKSTGQTTVTNGTASQTFNGSITVAGASGIGAAGVQVGKLNSAGVVSIVGGGTGGHFNGDGTPTSYGNPSPAPAQSQPGTVSSSGPTITGNDLKTAGKAAFALPIASSAAVLVLPAAPIAIATGLGKSFKDYTKSVYDYVKFW